MIFFIFVLGQNQLNIERKDGWGMVVKASMMCISLLKS